MPEKELFLSTVRSKGDKAGVFECDGETCYFYLYEIKKGEGQKIIDSVRILVGIPDFGEKDVGIRWDEKETKVGLFINGQLWAAFDTNTGIKHGGNYQKDIEPEIPTEIVKIFEL